MASDLITPPIARVPNPAGPSRSPRVWPLRTLTALAIAGVAATVILGLWGTPDDVFMHSYVRLLYIHPPMAWVSFVAYGGAFLASLAYLWPRPRSLAFDRVAGASVEVGVVFTGLTLVTGSIWGR